MEENKDDKVYLLFDGFKTRIGYTPASDSYWMSIASDNNLYREMVYEFQRKTGIQLDDLAKSYGSYSKGMTHYFIRRRDVEWFIEAIRVLYSCFDNPSVLCFVGDDGFIKGKIDVGNKPDNKTEKEGEKFWKGNLPEGRKLRSSYCRGRIVRGEVAEK